MVEFEEDNVVPLGDYFYSRSSKEVVRKGTKRSRDQGGLEALIANQIIQTQHPGDLQIDAIDTTTTLGAFTCANLDAVNTLSKELDIKMEEINKLEEGMDKSQKEHKAYVSNIEKEFEDRFKKSQLKNTSLQAKLHDEQAINDSYA